MDKKISLLREFSVPLVLGVITALVWVNIAPQSYYKFIKSGWLLGYHPYFLVNDIFMAFFFALAGVEMVQSLSPGGDLNPIRKAINPLFAALGGVMVPILVYLGLNALIGSPELTRGWGIPTATDIALAWLAARFIFGKSHPAVNFLLLLTIADDAIGLIIVAIFYPEPLYPVQPVFLLLVLAGMVVAYFLRKIKIKNYWMYLLTAGLLSWTGLYYSYLHPALALIFIIPFIPHPIKSEYNFGKNRMGRQSALVKFKRQWSGIVDFGLFMFGLTNAGVEFTMGSTLTWLVICSLIIGKTVGIYVFSSIANNAGFSLPRGMQHRELLVAALIAAMGLTVALLITGAAFTDTTLQNAAKMGALLSVSAAPLAFILSRILKITTR